MRRVLATAWLSGFILFVGACTEVTLIQGTEKLDAMPADLGLAEDLGPSFDPGLLEVDTGVSDDAPLAGEVVQVFCTVEGLPDDVESPPTSWTLVASPASAVEPTAHEDTMTFTTTGEYRLQCQIDSTGYKDPTPAKIFVWAGGAAQIDTVVDPTSLEAGDLADVICTGKDDWGNHVEEWEVQVSGAIDGGLVASGLKLKGLNVGTYDVACAQLEGPVDDTPVAVTVTHGLPKRIKTLLDTDSIVAGTSTGISCEAEDKYGNPVPDLPMTVALPDALSMEGFSVGGQIAGAYVVTCVPAGLDWGAFILEKAFLKVVPADPVALDLEVMPPKPYFATYEKLTLVPLAHDEFGNLVLEPELTPVVVEPDAHWKDKGDLAFIFKEEGYYKLTVALAGAPDQIAWVEVAIEGAPPTLVITHPERAETLVGSKPSVTVTGVAQDTIAGIEKVLVNGDEAAIEPDGSFTKIVVPKWGLNLLVVEAIDTSGAITTIKQSFVFSEAYYAMEPELPRVPDALKLWLSKEFIDDGVHNPTHVDDMATVVEVALANLDLSSALSDTEIGAGYTLYTSNLNFNPPKVSLTPIWGGLKLVAKIKNLHIDLKLKGECKVLGIDLCPDFSGSVDVEEILIDSDMMISATEGVLTTTLQNVDVKLGYLDLNINGILGWLFDFVIDFVVNIFSDQLEDAFKDQVEDELGDQVADLLNELAISETFNIDGLLPGMPPIELAFDTNIWSASFSPHGGRLGLGGRFLTSKKVPWNTLGSVARGTCLKGMSVNWQVPGESNFEAAVFDDFLNLAMTSLWYGGALNLSLDAESIGDEDGLDLGGLPVDDFTLDIQFLLPPIINGCESDEILYLQLGDFFLDAELFSPLFEGGVGKIGAYITLEFSAEVLTEETDEGTAISLFINDLESLDFHWEYVPLEFEGSEDVLEDLVKKALLDKMLEDLTGQSLAEFMIPAFDLGDLGGAGGDDVVIQPVIETMLREDGHTLVQGYLE